MRAIVRNNKYPYAHKVFKCAKCIKKQRAAIEALNVGDTYTNGKMVVRIDDVFIDIVYASVFEAVPPYDCIRMCAKSAQQIIAELNAANATKWTPPEGYKLAMPFWKKATKE